MVSTIKYKQKENNNNNETHLKAMMMINPIMDACIIRFPMQPAAAADLF